MQLGMVGLGRMGGNMVRRLLRASHQCVVFDRSPAVVRTFVGENATGAASLADKGSHYVDVGTSGGVRGLERGYCMMIGGEKASRFRSRGEAAYRERLLSAMRFEFGGHVEKVS